MILLETTACIDYLRGVKSIKTLIQENEDLFAITTISIYEVSIGLERTKRLRSENIYDKQVRSWRKFMALMKVLELTPIGAEKAAQVNDHLSQTGKMIEDDDILIAGIMGANNIEKIVTRNKKHFEKIPNITVLNYST